MTDANIYERLLRIIEIERRKPSAEALTQLVSAYMTCVPFENVSKLFYLKRYGLRDLPTFESYLDGIERFHFGGTCYANNYYLHLLLEHLGYDVRLCGADMNNPDVHVFNIVSIEDREFIVDAGYAAPFLKPLPRDLDEDHVIELGRDRYILKPQDEAGRSQVVMYRDGEAKHGYTAKPMARSIDYFAPAIKHSFRDEATFLNSLLLVRFFLNRSIRIQDLSVIESEGTSYRVQGLSSRDELPGAVEQHFSIPREIVTEVTEDLGKLGDS